MRLLWPVVPLLSVVFVPSPGRGQSEACVPLPTASFEIERTRRQSSPPDPAQPTSSVDVVGFSTGTLFDVDGDGTADVFSPEPQPGDCVSTMHVGVYLDRGGCGLRVGGIVGRPSLTPRRTNGLFDLVTTSEETIQDDPREPAVSRTHERTYRFDGSRYRETAHTLSDSVCHHCSLASCVTRPIGR